MNTLLLLICIIVKYQTLNFYLFFHQFLRA